MQGEDFFYTTLTTYEKYWQAWQRGGGGGEVKRDKTTEK